MLVFEVYQHTSPSGKAYVGWTSRGMQARWVAHVSEARVGSDTAFHRAIRKYGAQAFKHELLERMSTEVGAKRAEQLWIAQLGTFGASGYNLSLGGDGSSGHVTSEETRARLRIARARQKPISEETRELMREASRGRCHTRATREKMRRAHVGRKFTEEHCAHLSEVRKGRVISVEWREKLSASQKGKPKHSAAARARIAAANRARVWTDESRERASESAKRRRS